jgi:hypothetical protein
VTRSVILSAAKDLKTQMSQLEILRRLRDSGWRQYCLPEDDAAKHDKFDLGSGIC